MEKKKITCTSCGGSGQISFFQGVSRFLLTMEECPECSGMGYLPEKKTSSNGMPGNKRQKKGKKG